LEKKMNLKKTLFALSFFAMLAAAFPLRAQTGCDDSPEDPTVVLALVGGAGALVAGVWRLRKR
jgi:XrtJ-associated TM-motif-TM protein